MYYYQFHIGDYRAATAHLSNEEDLAYRRLLDMYYDTERPIPKETDWVARRLRLDTQTVILVLQDFFVLHEDGWRHPKCDAIIASYHGKAEINRENGKKGGRPKTQSVPNGMPVESQSQPTGKATKNHKPITNNQEPLTNVEKKQRATRLPTDWMPNDDEVNYCKTKRPDLQWQQVAENFRDYWIAQAGARANKTDWSATWRTWVRNEKGLKAPYENAKDKARRETIEFLTGKGGDRESFIDIN